MSSEDFIRKMSSLMEKNESFATATIVGTKGSTTGRMGFKILISHDGSILEGNLGGGCSESNVVEEALQAIKEGKPRMMSVLLEEEEKGGIGANCGGSMELYIEPFGRRNELVVFGGGGERSIAGPLVRIAKILNFDVVVIDPGASQEMYPGADKIIPAFADKAREYVRFGKNTSIVIVTKHKYDEPSLRAVIGLDVPYIGLVSSHHRASALFKALVEKDGVREEDLRKIHVPVGIDIQAESYEEIALSIMAEIIKTLKGGTGASLFDSKGVYSRALDNTISSASKIIELNERQ